MDKNAPFFVRIMYKKGGILQYYPGNWNRLHAIAVPLASGSVPRADQGRRSSRSRLFWVGFVLNFLCQSMSMACRLRRIKMID